MHRRAILYALASAALFGISTPAAKILLGAINPIVLAGLLYCGAGVGVALLRRFARGALQPSNAPQVAVNRKDVPWARWGDSRWRRRRTSPDDVGAGANGRRDSIAASHVGRRGH